MTPKASRTRVEWDDPVRVYVTSPPSDGEANEAVVAALAKALHVPKTSLQIIRGQTGRDKTLAVEGISAEDLAERVRGLRGG
ncbi:MAG: DUF167 domain-containing protein [Fimbriimonadaceae bacterium]|nr:DUF167 domain-containing protein [Fimbriimonadaceae bacterium]QYK56976.1 MAG: DUF167 domain-containing protein [Fimbriimonadaceae bacterium]